MRNPARLASRFPDVLVTGARSGLGERVAAACAADGLCVYATSRDAARLPRAERFVPLALDLSEAGAAERFLGSAPWERPPALLVNNAGYGVFGGFAALPLEEWRRQVEVLLHGSAVLARAFLQAGSAVVNVSSLAVDFPLPYFHAYNAAKAGLSGLSRSLALEYPGGGGRPFVLDLRPGDYRTPFQEAAGRVEEGGPAAVWDRIAGHLQAGADPATLWPPLRRALLRGRSRTLRVGRPFQARLAPLGARFLPDSWLRALHRRYYGLGS